MKTNIIIFFAIIFLIGCAEESEKLVNPPEIANTIHLRFINLGGSNESRTLELLNNEKIEDIAYATSSVSINPPADSTIFKVFQGGTLEYDYRNIYRFRIRNVKYTFLALPRNLNSPMGEKNVDTLLNFRTALTIPTNTDEALVRFFNANPDSTVTYSLRLGCPNGMQVAPFSAYKSVMFQGTVVKSGTVAFSLIRSQNSQTEIVNLYSAEIEPQGQYTFIMSLDANGEEKMLLLNENNLESDALQEATVVEERFANIRTINLSGSNVEVGKLSGDMITAGLTPNYIDTYNNTEACGSEEPDTLLVSSGALIDTVSATLDVLQNYSLVVFSGINKLQSVLVPPAPNTLEAEGKATIRVVHGSKNIDGITVSLGARNSPYSKAAKDKDNFIIGELLATQLNYGEVSLPKYLEPSVEGQPFKIPVTVFSSTEPAQLVFTTLPEIEAGKEYLLLINDDEFDRPQAYLIEKSEEDQTAEELVEGVMLQIVHAVPGLDEMNVTVGNNLLIDAKLYFSGSLSTVVPAGSQNVNLNGLNFDLSADPLKRPFVIASGESSAIDVFAVNNEPMGAVSGEYKRRFVNASIEVLRLGIKEVQDTLPAPIVVDYKATTAVESFNLANKQAFYFTDFNSGEEIYTIGDINPSFAKNYYYVFAGKKEVGDGYTLIILQEF